MRYGVEPGGTGGMLELTRSQYDGLASIDLTGGQPRPGRLLSEQASSLPGRQRPVRLLSEHVVVFGDQALTGVPGSQLIAQLCGARQQLG